MAFCCDLFESLVENSGKRGFGIVAKSKMNLRAFFLQCRTHDSTEVEDLIRQPTVHTSNQGNISSICQQAVKFCPFCGADLEKWINENEEVFAKLALNHKHLFLE